MQNSLFQEDNYNLKIISLTDSTKTEGKLIKHHDKINLT